MPHTLDCGCVVNDFGQITDACATHTGITAREAALVEIGDAARLWFSLNASGLKVGNCESRALGELQKLCRAFDAKWGEGK